jgi:hypothetical protein
LKIENSPTHPIVDCGLRIEDCGFPPAHHTEVADCGLKITDSHPPRIGIGTSMNPGVHSIIRIGYEKKPSVRYPTETPILMIQRFSQQTRPRFPNRQRVRESAIFNP